MPYEPGVLDVCKARSKTFEYDRAASSRKPSRIIRIEAVWQAVAPHSRVADGGALLAFYNDPAKRALMKPEAIYEVESGLKLIGLRHYCRISRCAPNGIRRCGSFLREI